MRSKTARVSTCCAPRMMSLTSPWLVPQAMAIWVWLAPVAQELEQPPDGAAAQGIQGLGSLPERVRDDD